MSNTKTIFTRVTLDPISLQAVQKIQLALPNYTLNDAVKMLLGIGVKNVNSTLVIDDNGFSPKTEEILTQAKNQIIEGKIKTFSNTNDILNYVQNSSN